MQVDRERAAASPTTDSVTPSPSHQSSTTPDQRSATPNTPPRTTKRRLLPQPDRAIVLQSSSSTTSNNNPSDLCPSASAVSSRFFVPISVQRDQERESSTHSSRRSSLVVDTGVGETLASLAAASVAVSTTAELHNRRMLDEALISVHDNNSSNANIPASCRDNDDSGMLPTAATTATPSRRQRYDQFMTSTVTKLVDVKDNDNDKVRPEEEHEQQFTRSTFRSATLPRRWKSHRQNEEPAQATLLVSRDNRKPWAEHTRAYNDVTQREAEPQSSVINCSSNPTSIQSHATSASALARFEAMRDRFRRLSEMYRNSLEEETASTFTKTKSMQIDDVGVDVKDQQSRSASDPDSNGTDASSKVTSATKISTTVASDTESLSSCGRDEGFESETATGSVVNGVDGSCPESRHSSKCSADDVVALTTTESATMTETTTTTTMTMTTVGSGANLFASSIDSIIQQPTPRSSDGQTAFTESTPADFSPSSSQKTSSTDEIACSGTLTHEDTTAPTSTSARQSRLREQREFADRMSAPRRSITRSPQRRTATSWSNATSRSGLYSSPMVRRKTRTTPNGGLSPAPRDRTPPGTGVEQRRMAEFDGTAASSRFVRGSIARTSLPHYGISVRAYAGSDRPTNLKQSLPLTTAGKNSLSNHTYKSPGKVAECQTGKASSSTGWCHAPAVSHVDRNGVQAKPSSNARVFSTPVRFGPTSHQTQTRPATAARQNEGDTNSVLRAVTTDGQSCQQTAENDTELFAASPRISERKSVFERLFEMAHHKRYSKLSVNSAASSTSANANTACTQGQVVKLQRKLSLRRPRESSTN